MDARRLANFGETQRYAVAELRDEVALIAEQVYGCTVERGVEDGVFTLRCVSQVEWVTGRRVFFEPEPLR